MKLLGKLLITTILTTALLISCGQKADDTSKTEITTGSFKLPPTGTAFTLDGTPVVLAGITFTPASEWTDFGPSGMRKASYAFGPVKDEADSATVTVFYFGQGGGGTIEANLGRWVGQMNLAEGMTPENATQRGSMTVAGMNVHLVRVEGVYNAGSMMGAPTAKENYVMVGAVLEAPEGNVFFKMTGPIESGNAMAEVMIEMIKKIKKA